MTNVPDAVLQGLAAVGGTAGVAALIKGLTDWRTAGSTTRKTDADAEKVEVDGAQVLTAAVLQMLEPLQRQVTWLSDELAKSQARVVALGRYVEVLTTALRGAQIPIPDHPPALDEGPPP